MQGHGSTHNDGGSEGSSSVRQMKHRRGVSTSRLCGAAERSAVLKLLVLGAIVRACVSRAARNLWATAMAIGNGRVGSSRAGKTISLHRKDDKDVNQESNTADEEKDTRVGLAEAARRWLVGVSADVRVKLSQSRWLNFAPATREPSAPDAACFFQVEGVTSSSRFGWGWVANQRRGADSSTATSEFVKKQTVKNDADKRKIRE